MTTNPNQVSNQNPQNGYLKYLKNFKFIMQTPVIKQLMFMVGLAISIALGIVIYMTIEEPIYRPLDYRVTSQNMSTVVDVLDKAGIRYKLNDQEGIIYVAAKDTQLARLKLSASGIQKDDGFNYSFLNEQANIGNSQFVENARYLRALENDLSKTIGALEGITGARVHIAIPQNNVFADENAKPTASVVLSMGPGIGSDKEKIRAIVEIVAGSVPGLDPKDVAITDQYGHYLSGVLDQDSMYRAEQMNYQNKIQTYYEKRIETMLVPMVGENKISVRVNANIDFSQNEEAKESYDPSTKAIRSEQSVSEQSGSGAASGAPGSLANTPPQSDSEKGAGGAAAAAAAQSGQGGASQGRNESIKNYELTKSVTYKKANYAKINSLSVAVVLDNQTVLDPKTKKMVTKPLDKEMLTKITDLVKATVGFDEKRGDKVTVVNSSFNVSDKDMVVGETALWNQPWFWDLVKKFIGMGIGFIFLFFLYKQIAKSLKSAGASGGVMHGTAMLEEREDPGKVTQEMSELKQEQINKLKELANREPGRVAFIIKNWVGKQ